MGTLGNRSDDENAAA